MKSKINGLPELYLEALRAHLAQDSPGSFKSAHDMGRQSLAIGLETLDVAKIHEIALAALILPDCPSSTRDGMTTRAAIFFTEAITPIEETHRVALEDNLEMQRVRETLDLRTKDVADSNREMEHQIIGRQTAEAALQSNEQASSQLLKESRLLEEHLRDIARKILSANEEERKRMSRQLQDEIAQTLLGIHVRLLVLKKEAAANNEGLTEEIATTQRLVEDSVKTINCLAGEFAIPHAS